jgi:hypothetical protein
MAERHVAGNFNTAQQARQTFLAVQRPQAAGQDDPVPGLFELVVAEAALELALQDAASVLGAQLGQQTTLG